MTIAQTFSRQAVLAIDIQKGFAEPFWGKRNNPEFESNITWLFTQVRALGLPLLHVKHASSNPHSPLHAEKQGHDFANFARPLASELSFNKSVHSAFGGTPLLGELIRQRISHLCIVGLCTDHCVSTSVREASDWGFHVTVLEDATATFDRNCSLSKRKITAEEVHHVHLASLSDEFACVSDTKDWVQLAQRQMAQSAEGASGA